MLLQLKTSELGGGRNPPPQVQRVFKSPGKIGLIYPSTSQLALIELRARAKLSETKKIEKVITTLKEITYRNLDMSQQPSVF